jgi:uncharacterized protein
LKVVSGLFIYILVIAFLGITMYTANQVQIKAWGQTPLLTMWFGAVFLMFVLALLPIQAAFLTGDNLPAQFSPELSSLPEVSIGSALAAAVFSVAMGVISLTTVTMPQMRIQLARMIGHHGKFDPDSQVHITGIVLSCLLLAGVITSFVAGGGLEGLAQSIESTGINATDTLFTGLLEVLAAALSVGYAIRRDGRQTLERLGLVAPDARQIRYGVGAGALLAVAAILYGTLWELLAPSDQLQEQTQAIEQLTLALSSLPVALLVSIAAAVGEEIFIRGALQPVFGIFLSSIFFTLLHTQYLITPSLLLIFGISVAFGLLRQRFNTTTAVIAHFVYNFIPLFIIALGMLLGGTTAS